MTIDQTNTPTARRPLRLWPGIVIVTVQWLMRFVLPVAVPDATPYGVLAGIAGGPAVVLWWLFFSRAPWSERVGAVVLIAVAMFATSTILDESIATGAMGMLFPILASPVLSLAFVAWAVGSRRLSDGPRRAAMVATILFACGTLTLVRTGGFTGSFDQDLHWRWTATPEERLLAQVENEPADASRGGPAAPSPVPAIPEPPKEGLVPEAGEKPAAPATTTVETPEKRIPAEAGDKATALSPDRAAAKTGADWPGFRGPDRDSIIRGVRIETDWTASPPIELWRRPIGPGWSSFAVRGDLIYTQEQRGDEEVVASYKVTTGDPVWRHRDPARFWESNGGAGPRGTPTLSNGRVYTLGATGILNALDARNGGVVWSRNAASDTRTEIPDWGFSSSPLVVGDLVIVAAAGVLAAYDIATGEPRWFGPTGRGGYSSPHLATVGGVAQIVFLNGEGAIGLAPADGALHWKHSWRGDSIVQPAVTESGEILIGSGAGIRSVAIAHRPGGWSVEERWTSNGLKPYFNDFVVHKGHAFGFDGSILASIDVKDGKRKWKGGRYGNGQLVLLPDQDLLLVLSEEGELALVGATPDQFRELARFPAIEGKTWNHPVLVGDVLLVRNGQEMAAFRLSLARQ